MSKSAERLKSQLIRLSQRDRAELAHFLFRSLKESDQDEQAAWDPELASRLQEIKSGKAKGEPAAKVFAELRKKYS